MHKLPARQFYFVERKKQNVSDRSRLRLPRGKVETRRVTVCVAAVASHGSTIVCIADKALSYGDQIVWDSDSTKIICLNGGDAVALTAGAEGYIARYLMKISPFKGYKNDLLGIICFLEEKYKETFEEIQDIEVLIPHGITREQYVAAISSPGEKPVIQCINEQMTKFQRNFDCQLLVCGFWGGSQPYILDIGPPGRVTDYTAIGFHAVGEGASSAVGRLLFVGHKRTDGVAHTLFDCFDAKAAAEMTASVGYEWDGYFITGAGARRLVEDAKPLIDRVWAKRNRSPFRKKKDPDALPNPPGDWEIRLRKFVAKSLGVENDIGIRVDKID